MLHLTIPSILEQGSEQSSDGAMYSLIMFLGLGGP